MKSTGIVRRVDELGRIVIPIELRNKLKIAEKDPDRNIRRRFFYNIKKIRRDLRFLWRN